MFKQEEHRVLICMPHGKDAALACRVLESETIACQICKNIPELLLELSKGAALVLTVEEALPPGGASEALQKFLATQPSWSDLPILVLTKPGGSSPWLLGAYERLGNLTLIERPVRAPTLISSVRSTLRARLKQYEVRQSDQRKDEYLAMLAHELRNPLSPISSAAYLLEFVASDEAKVKQASEIIIRQVVHMTNLIDDLLDVARVTRGLISLDKEPLDIRLILSEAVEQVSPLIHLKRQRLTLESSQKPVMVLGDRKRLIQVVANLLNNASKYTPEDGKLLAKIETDSDGVCLSISDNGIGMTEETLGHVFDLFTQAERSSDRSQGGLGLGLALVKSLTLAHGGAVKAYSKGLGKGSEFVVRLDLVSSYDSDLNRLEKSREVSSPQEAMRILIVDDNVDAANTMQMFLTTLGHEVFVEYAALPAIALAKKVLPQVCLLDIGLPDIDGYELARQLRSISEIANVVLVAVTGYGQEQDKAKAIAEGFDHHFVKPVDPAQLNSLLTQLGSVTTLA